jgi:trehalose-phosphatase
LGKPILCVFDFDGTLAPLVDHPGRAGLSPPSPARIGTLRGKAGVAVLSGRALRDVRRRVGIKGIVYGGNHGVEMGGQGHAYLHPAARRLKSHAGELLRRARRVFKDVPGVIIEGKGFGVSVHFRRVAPPFRRMFDRGVRNLKKETHALAFLWTRGHKVWDLRPPTGWNKGKALDLFWRRWANPSSCAWGMM